jgi:hypothetical protein
MINTKLVQCSHIFSAFKRCYHVVYSKIFHAYSFKIIGKNFIHQSRAQDTSQRNVQTRTFFNFSYKRYIPVSLWHLCPMSHFMILYKTVAWSNTPIYPGGHLPDNNNHSPSHTHELDLPLLKGVCKIPMSQERRACVSHQKTFFRNRICSKMMFVPKFKYDLNKTKLLMLISFIKIDKVKSRNKFIQIVWEFRILSSIKQMVKNTSLAKARAICIERNIRI